MITLISIVLTIIIFKKLAAFFIENDSGKPWLDLNTQTDQWGNLEPPEPDKH